MSSNVFPLGVVEIQKLIPHRHPFLMVDSVLEVSESRPGSIIGRNCRAVKNVTFNEGFFVGHFPQQPVMPGVLILEALAQTGALGCSAVPGDAGIEQLYLAGVNNVKFKSPVFPGAVLDLTVNIKKEKSHFYLATGKAFVEGKMVVQADILAYMTFKKS